MTATYGKIKLEISNEFLIAAIFTFQIINAFLAEILTVYGLPTLSMMAYVVIYGFSALAWLRAFEKRAAMCVGVLLTYFVLLAISIIMNDNVQQYVFNFGRGTIYEIMNSNFAILLGLCLPPFMLSCCGVDFTRIRKHLYNFSVIALILFCIMMFLQSFVHAQRINYMSVAYSALPCFFFVYFEARDKGNKFAYVVAATSFFGLFIGGCRGALLSAVVYVVLLELYLLKPLTMKKLLWVVVFSVAMTIVLLNLTPIITWMDKFLGGFGYSSRLLDKFLDQSADGDLFHFDDRQVIIDRTMENLGLFGNGIYGDRIVLRGTYPHNFILEILCQYGVIFGVIIIGFMIVFLYRLGKVAKRMQNNYFQCLFFCLLCSIFVKMMFSASYLTDRPFWLLLGLGYGVTKVKSTVQRRTSDGNS